MKYLTAMTMLTCIAAISFATSAKQLALTFDDAPRPDTSYFDSAERNKRLLNALNKHDVSAMFFVTTKHLEKGRTQRLVEYSEHHQLLANHTHSHRSANKIDPVEFIADVAKAHQILLPYKNYHPYFRFPFLHHGDTDKKVAELRAGLQKIGLKQGYVTIEDSDWYLDSLFQKAVQSGMPIELEKWRDVYVSHLLASANYYEKLAVKNLDTPVKQVMLLHENDLAALFIDDFIQALKKDQWQIISPLEAYQDNIASRFPKTLHNNQGRLAAILAEKGIPPISMVLINQRPEALKKRLQRLNLLPKAQ
ncbi:polysaccharide deacetylase family protein [Paraglaciecola aquimarina]|uniref:Polysaccharide deacetylase family protein n=1 Tax=Paraglaciecola aquimarina TaxID=1235557 RepID=A0ABU3T190_9ALTE|nr:polysaccharide deacetylase family protein [Paraglaciecola aquimarina]MDU0356028.1 polysaccharide deacetylase family protein [Paraglaciecola aquimarina]